MSVDKNSADVHITTVGFKSNNCTSKTIFINNAIKMSPIVLLTFFFFQSNTTLSQFFGNIHRKQIAIYIYIYCH